MLIASPSAVPNLHLKTITLLLNAIITNIETASYTTTQIQKHFFQCSDKFFGLVLTTNFEYKQRTAKYFVFSPCDSYSFHYDDLYCFRVDSYSFLQQLVSFLATTRTRSCNDSYLFLQRLVLVLATTRTRVRYETTTFL